MPTLGGDANLDGRVDVADLGLLAAHYGQAGAEWYEGDFNYSGGVDVGDLGILAAQYRNGDQDGALHSSEYVRGQYPALQAAVPDPAGSGLPTAAGLALLGRRRRRRG